jgi:hypothetical protein
VGVLPYTLLNESREDKSQQKTVLHHPNDINHFGNHFWEKWGVFWGVVVVMIFRGRVVVHHANMHGWLHLQIENGRPTNQTFFLLSPFSIENVKGGV